MAQSRAVDMHYDKPMWESIRNRRMALQSCEACGEFQYPPGPTCPHCLSLSLAWKPLSGRGKIISWVVFHRQYFDDYPPPFNVVAVQLAEGPIIITNLVGPEPDGSWIGHDIEIVYEPDARGELLNRVRLAGR